MKTPRVAIKFLLFFTAFVNFQSTCIAKVEAVLGSIAVKDNQNIAFSIPTSELPEIILSRDQYILSYNKLTRNPNWVAWKIEISQMGGSGRSDAFDVDSDLKNYLLNSQGAHFSAVEADEYRGSCFDRGHQIPSADRTDDIENNKVTFLMSNMIPQTPYLNRVIWEHLEQYERNLVRNQNKKVYIIAGPIYDKDLGKIGPHADIEVPSKNFKVIIVLEANQTPADINSNTEIISVIMPNILQDGTSPTANTAGCNGFTTNNSGSADDWQKYKTTLAEIETLSGIKLFTH